MPINIPMQRGFKYERLTDGINYPFDTGHFLDF